MKKFISVILIIILGIFLTSCDYPEKDIYLLPDYEIPKEVTRDFNVPRGKLGIITYTSSHPEIFIIEDYYSIKVIQQETDVMVTLEARVNKAYKTFKINVLKIGSNLTNREYFNNSIVELQDVYPKQFNEPIKLIEEYNGFNLDYRVDEYQKLFKIIKKKDQTKWLVPMLGSNHISTASLNITQTTFKDDYIPSKTIALNYNYLPNFMTEHEKVFFDLGVDFKYYNNGVARLYLNHEEIVDFSYKGLNDEVIIEVIFNGFKNDYVEQDNLVVKFKYKEKYNVFNFKILIITEYITQIFTVHVTVNE